MEPTLEKGERVAAIKYVYPSKPNYGDVVVFRLPKDPSVVYIKRIIGLPGDRVQMIGGAVYLNGKPIKRERIEDLVKSGDKGITVRTKRWQETMPNGGTYQTLDLVENGFYDNTQVYDVPEGHYFVMGDNRDNSMDSRVLSHMGYIPAGNILGRATSP
jgi:signal peptidase I